MGGGKYFYNSRIRNSVVNRYGKLSTIKCIEYRYNRIT